VVARPGAGSRRAGCAPQHRLALAALAGLALVGALAMGASGCDNLDNGPEICPRPATSSAVLYDDGTVDGGVYESAPWTGELLWYPGGALYGIRHHLGHVPIDAHFWLSFDRDGLAHGGSLTEAAGNEAEVMYVSDEYLTVMNGTCADYWLRAVIW
jgi:hypothetical protein